MPPKRKAMSRISSKGIREGARAAGYGSAVPTAATPFPPRAVIDSDFARAERDRGEFASQASAGLPVAASTIPGKSGMMSMTMRG